LVLPSSAVAQTELAGVYGRVTDQSGGVIIDAEVEIKNVETNLSVTVKTNQDGLYTIPSLHPGHYLISARKPGFKTVTVTQLDLNVQDNIVRNFALQVGSIAETVTITADTLNVNTTDASVSTVVDRQFAENLPLNGRSFQTLIQLTPGVVLTVSNFQDSGQFSVNGQRASSNYWMVDGVSANTGIGTSNAGNGAGGALPSFSVLGGTNSLVSVDALQEFRIQTSTYAPEFGRTPGAQISILTRSGTNQLHGTLFEYFRNDALDANNWFANAVTPALPKAKERQNDFGGTFSGPLLKDRTFFFFSYEGLRLRLPQTALTTVPDLSARQNAILAVQPFLNAYPFDPKQPDLGNGIAQFNASVSSPATLDAYSIRIDHRLNSKVSLFGRYNYSPSEILQRGAGFTSLSSVISSSVTAQTATVGATWMVSPVTANDIRFNYSRTRADGGTSSDNFGGAVPVTSLVLPSPFTLRNSFFIFEPFDLPSLGLGAKSMNTQRQINIVDNLSAQRGSHSLKFGVDFRRLSPIYAPLPFNQQVFFLDTPSAETGDLYLAFITSSRGSTLLFRNLGLFAQDSWRFRPRLTLTYGLRWDVDFTPSSLNGPSLPAVTGYNLNDLSHLALAPDGTAAFNTTYGNVSPRIGLAYQVTQNPDWGTVLRGGFGVFYDLATSEAGNNISALFYPFAGTNLIFGTGIGGTGTFPLSPTDAAPPPITSR